MNRPPETLEDLRDLDSFGVGANEAAERTGFPSAHAMEKWLERKDEYPLWLRLKARDPEGSHPSGKKRATQAVEAPTRDQIATLLLNAEKSPAARTRNKAKKIRALLDDLTAALEADKGREEARKEVERLERQLRAAKARLKGDAVTLRAWAHENGLECPAMGRVPFAVREAYEAAQEVVA